MQLLLRGSVVWHESRGTKAGAPEGSITGERDSQAAVMRVTGREQQEGTAGWCREGPGEDAWAC